MARSVTDTFKAAVFTQNTDEAFLVLITIDHTDLTTPIRLSSDTVDTTSNGLVYVAYPFTLSLPSDPETGVTRGRFTIDNVAQDYIAAIRSINTPPTVGIQIILASDPDTVEVEFSDFQMVNIDYDKDIISADLSIDYFMTEPYPGDVFLPSKFPGLF